MKISNSLNVFDQSTCCMSKKSISLKAKLDTLFSEYQARLKKPEQFDIIRNGFAFSEVNPDAKILVMGINPSMRNDFLNTNGYSYNYKELSNDRYFKKFPILLSDLEHLGITYCDLFYQRHTEQKQINHFLKDEMGRSFLKEQLTITREVIEHISPKLILLFNKQGSDFFSKEWIGLTVHPYNSDKLKRMIPRDLYNLPDINAMIYFSRFLGYRTSKEVFRNLRIDLANISSIIKKQ